MKNPFRILSKNIKVTGVSTPVGGITLEYSNSEKDLAEELITYLENRRVLFSFVSDKCPGGMIQSINKIRHRIQGLREKLTRNSDLFELLSSMLLVAHEFLEYACRDCKQPSTCNECSIYEEGCAKGLVVFREKIGGYIEELCKKHDLKADNRLRILFTKNQEDIPNNNVCPALLK